MAQAPSPTLQAPRRWKARHVALGVVSFALLALLLPPFVNVNRFKGHIANSMGQALGRKVSVGGISLRLLPRPGFNLHNLVIAEDPAFGAEPMLRADEVRASFRLASLWRGRLEVASLDLKSGANINPPSLNLVRAADGRWNIETLLQRASQTPSAPTAQPHADSRPRFPYIEADTGRINLKFGAEKKVYALSDADFALWLASENEWAFRLSARPVRIDFNLGDTGTLKVSGKFRRAANLHETPLEISASLQDAQLGQMTKLIYGRDRGWRGALEVNAAISGTPAALNVSAQARVEDLRRYDISTTETLRLTVRCTANYSSSSDQLSDATCRMPMADGMVLAKGSVTAPMQPRAYDLSVSAEKVGVQSLVTLARHAKKDIPDDLVAAGTVDAAFSVKKADGEASQLWAGDGRTSDVTMRASVLSPVLQIPALKFTVEGPGTEHYVQTAPARNGHRHAKPAAPPETVRVAVAPFGAELGAATPADATAWFSGDGYEIDVQGDARIPRLLQVGRAFGLRVPQYQVDGSARVDVKVAGSWAGFATPSIIGSAQLRSVNAPIRGLNAPVQLATANLLLAPDAATLQNITAHFPGSLVAFGGWLRMGRNCDTLETCPIQFDLQADQLALDDLNRLLNPSQAKRPWYDVFGNRPHSLLNQVQASGRITANTLAIRRLQATHLVANAELHSGLLQLSGVTANVLGGKYHGSLQANFMADKPAYKLDGSLAGAAVAQLATLTHDNWGAGTINAGLSFAASGITSEDLLLSSRANADFQWNNGALRHVSLNGQAAPLQFKAFTGHLEFAAGSLTVSRSKMTSAASIYQVSGTATLDRQLRMKMENSAQSYELTGTLEKPKVTLVGGETQAALKP